MSAEPFLYHIESVATPGECWEIVQGRQPTEYEGDPAFVITPLFKSANQPDTGDVAALREALAGIRWHSVDRDNMEFTARISCFQKDEIDAALSKPNAQGREG